MNKTNYLSPMVEIMNARVEKGFQMSGTDPDLNTTIEPEVEGPEIDFNSFDWSQEPTLSEGGVPELRVHLRYLSLILAHPFKMQN